MVDYSDGSKSSIHRDGKKYVVEAIAANGNLIDRMECDDFEEAVAVMETHPSMW